MSHVAVFKLYNSERVDMFRPDTAHATSAESSGRLKAALCDAISMMIKKNTPSAQINAQISSATEAKWGSGSTAGYQRDMKLRV